MQTITSKVMGPYEEFFFFFLQNLTYKVIIQCYHHGKPTGTFLYSEFLF